MPAYEDWNKIDEDVEEELLDTSVRLDWLPDRRILPQPVSDLRREERCDSLLH